MNTKWLDMKYEYDWVGPTKVREHSDIFGYPSVNAKCVGFEHHMDILVCFK